MLHVSGNSGNYVHNSLGVSSVQDQQNPVDIFDRLEKINWANNQLFFINSFSHMFKGPINSILLASELLNNYVEDLNDQFDDLNDEPARLPAGFRESGLGILGCVPQVMEGIISSANKLNQFVSHLSELSGKGAITSSRDVDLNRLISLCAFMVHHQSCEYSTRFHLDLEPDLPVLPGNAQQVLQVVLSLLMNAFLSLSDRSRGVFLSASCNHAAGCVQICVHDQGTGISPEIFPRILDPFFTTWHGYGCMGIGLTVVDQVIRNHGGELAIDSEPGHGTRVSVSLPIHGQDKQDKCVTSDNSTQERHHA